MFGVKKLEQSGKTITIFFLLDTIHTHYRLQHYSSLWCSDIGVYSSHVSENHPVTYSKAMQTKHKNICLTALTKSSLLWINLIIRLQVIIVNRSDCTAACAFNRIYIQLCTKNLPMFQDCHANAL